MRKMQRTALLPFTAGQLYDLVNDVDAYPEFLPWCRSARVDSRSKTEMVATLDLALKALHKSFTTRNLLVPGREIHIQLVSGPFRRLRGHWLFDPLETDSMSGCRVTMQLEFALAGRILEMTAGPILEKVADSLVDLFSQRARQVLVTPASLSGDPGDADAG
ncbi:MAG TPA: ubiquinone-binding protein [Gammaproteobacteria bacterium]|nr:ubiquinone-binding protein [Gammaproteobacteria bacterium]